MAISLIAGLLAADFAWGVVQVMQGGHLLAAVGVGHQARYLVLAQDPAELRPTGGYSGTVGIIAMSNGQLTERSFKDVYFYDLMPNLPFVEPPEELANHLLGAASWRLADAAWSPDFPTSAQNALNQYTLESGDADIDGVIALTTYAVDRLIEVTGPIEVPEFGVTVAPGDVTLTALRLTRGVSTPTSDRKAFLDLLANRTIDKLSSLSPTEWPRLAEAVRDIVGQREVLVWFREPGLQSAALSHPLGGAVRHDSGDFLYVVEANVTPTSKYNLVVSRRDALDVRIGGDGAAISDLTLVWQNDSMLPGEPYESIRSFSTSKAGQYGAYVRVLTPGSSSLTAADGVATAVVAGPEIVETEAGRNVFGNYLLMNPGQSNMRYQWTVPGAATDTGGLWTYQLTVQKQPGARAVPTSVTVSLPQGAVLKTLPAGATADGGLITFDLGLESDAQLQITYRLP